MKNDKALILNQIKSHLGFTKDVDFAKFLGIAPQTLNSWYSRNRLDYELLYSKCVDIDGNWLITGAGNMVKKDTDPSILNEPLVEYTKTTDKDLLIASLQKNIVLLENCAALLEEKLRLSENALKEAEYKLLDQQAEISELQNRKQAG